ncbi:MAG TPA: hypothetical protein VGB30_14465 [bacterium]|jgi:hypothetical protein
MKTLKPLIGLIIPTFIILGTAIFAQDSPDPGSEPDATQDSVVEVELSVGQEDLGFTIEEDDFVEAPELVNEDSDIPEYLRSPIRTFRFFVLSII